MSEESRKAALDTYSDLVNPSKVRILASAGLDVVEAAREGIYVTDAAGRRYIDCFTSAGSFNLGRRHPAIVRAMIEAVEDEQLDLGNFPLLSIAKADLARRLAEVTPGDLDCVMFGTGGGEAVDFAIKLARGSTMRPGIVCSIDGYHGHTGFALSASGRDAYQDPFRPLMPGFSRVTFGDVGALEAAVGDDTAAVLLEPVQGEGGVVPAPRGYLEAARRICDAHGALLVLDEIQTGLGRTGRLFACEHSGVLPDIMTLAKSLGGGLYPISATVYRRELQDFVYMNPFVHLSTFGGSDIGCRVALATIDTLVSEGVPAHAASMGERFGEGFDRLRRRFPLLIREVRRLGLMIGVEYTDDSLGPRMSRELARQGVIAIFSANHSSVMRIMPPLVIQPDQVDEVLGAFGRAMSAIEAGPSSESSSGDPASIARTRRRPGQTTA
ncbi:MAG: aspartate aminotransferase family protein [Acidimicrobiales bacterium]